jgi:hypothetical protein
MASPAGTIARMPSPETPPPPLVAAMEIEGPGWDDPSNTANNNNNNNNNENTNTTLDAEAAAAWREREERQRTIRVLMMFLLMLLIMDGDEGNGGQNGNRRGRNGLRGNKRRKKANNETLFEPAVFQSRLVQDMHVRELVTKDARYQALIENCSGLCSRRSKKLICSLRKK